MAPKVTKAKKEKGEKAPKYYPADDIPVKVPSEREAASRGVAKLRKSITPGTVVILLAGRFRGRRVVVLKQLASGLLLVTGPYQVNGIPLRRVNQAYVIATSTKVDVSGVDTAKFVDSYFGKAKAGKKDKKSAEEMFEEAKATPEVSAERKADQAAVDAALMKSLKEPLMAKYLKARFSLSKADKPHLMKF
jgi:large subunit ribosomal protein L6e|mmetsp:Transcript_1006/g.2995  ORF Transcript_1006/g.2995 Transcript_1006/m.2995 type:complete len:191 (-) Transcript_1006:291-863(-)